MYDILVPKVGHDAQNVHFDKQNYTPYKNDQ